MASGLLSLKWNNHRSTFFHVLSTVRSKESYCDVTLACDGKFYPVHKLVLSTCSDYFERMFERTNCKHPIIVLKDIRHEELEALLNYMYVGEVNVLQNELAGLIKAAECLMIKGLAVPDEAPSPTKESKRTYQSSSDVSPHAKRRKRDDDGRLHSHNQHLHREGRETSQSQRHSSSASMSNPSSVGRIAPPSISPSPSVGSASDSVSEEFGQSQSETNEAQESSKHPVGESSSSQSKQSVPEVILDESAVKEEPAEIEEELPETKDIVPQFPFDPLQEGDSRSDPGGGGGGGYDSQMLSSQSQSVEDLVAEALPGSSGLQGNSLWEGEGSLQGFPMEGYSGDGSRPPQMVPKEDRVLGCCFTCSRCRKENVIRERNLVKYDVEGHISHGFQCPFCGFRSEIFDQVWHQFKQDQDPFSAQRHMFTTFCFKFYAVAAFICKKSEPECKLCSQIQEMGPISQKTEKKVKDPIEKQSLSNGSVTSEDVEYDVTKFDEPLSPDVTKFDEPLSPVNYEQTKQGDLCMQDAGNQSEIDMLQGHCDQEVKGKNNWKSVHKESSVKDTTENCNLHIGADKEVLLGSTNAANAQENLKPNGNSSDISSSGLSVDSRSVDDTQSDVAEKCKESSSLLQSSSTESSDNHGVPRQHTSKTVEKLKLAVPTKIRNKCKNTPPKSIQKRYTNTKSKEDFLEQPRQTSEKKGSLKDASKNQELQGSDQSVTRENDETERSDIKVVLDFSCELKKYEPMSLIEDGQVASRDSLCPGNYDQGQDVALLRRESSGVKVTECPETSTFDGKRSGKQNKQSSPDDKQSLPMEITGKDDNIPHGSIQEKGIQCKEEPLGENIQSSEATRVRKCATVLMSEEDSGYQELQMDNQYANEGNREIDEAIKIEKFDLDWELVKCEDPVLPMESEQVIVRDDLCSVSRIQVLPTRQECWVNETVKVEAAESPETFKCDGEKLGKQNSWDCAQKIVENDEKVLPVIKEENDTNRNKEPLGKDMLSFEEKKIFEHPCTSNKEEPGCQQLQVDVQSVTKGYKTERSNVNDEFDVCSEITKVDEPLSPFKDENIDLDEELSSGSFDQTRQESLENKIDVVKMIEFNPVSKFYVKRLGKQNSWEGASNVKLDVVKSPSMKTGVYKFTKNCKNKERARSVRCAFKDLGENSTAIKRNISMSQMKPVANVTTDKISPLKEPFEHKYMLDFTKMPDHLTCDQHLSLNHRSSKEYNETLQIHDASKDSILFEEIKGQVLEAIKACQSNSYVKVPLEQLCKKASDKQNLDLSCERPIKERSEDRVDIKEEDFEYESNGKDKFSSPEQITKTIGSFSNEGMPTGISCNEKNKSTVIGNNEPTRVTEPRTEYNKEKSSKVQGSGRNVAVCKETVSGNATDSPEKETQYATRSSIPKLSKEEIISQHEEKHNSRGPNMPENPTEAEDMVPRLRLFI